VTPYALGNENFPDAGAKARRQDSTRSRDGGGVTVDTRGRHRARVDLEGPRGRRRDCGPHRITQHNESVQYSRGALRERGYRPVRCPQGAPRGIGREPRIDQRIIAREGSESERVEHVAEHTAVTAQLKIRHSAMSSVLVMVAGKRETEKPRLDRRGNSESRQRGRLPVSLPIQKKVTLHTSNSG